MAQERQAKAARTPVALPVFLPLLKLKVLCGAYVNPYVTILFSDRHYIEHILDIGLLPAPDNIEVVAVALALVAAALVLVAAGPPAAAPAAAPAADRTAAAAARTAAAAPRTALAAALA